nr:MerR family transcriptional regulator [Tessaracoccus sp. MC1756]
MFVQGLLALWSTSVPPQSGAEVYTIKQVSGLTGVSEAVLRAWESRYGIVEPSRSEGRYRLYSDEQVAVLREMAALVGAGVPASRAAATLLAEVRDPGAAVSAFPGWRGMVEAAARLDVVALDAAIAAAAPVEGFEAFADVWLPDGLRELGEAWASGELGVAAEHFASAALMRTIAGAFEAAGPPTTPGKVLVGLPHGARHELMLFAFAACLRRLGADVVYLGADVPAAEWERAAREHRARAAVVGVTSVQKPSDGAQEVVSRLAGIAPPVSVWAGGSRRAEVEGAESLPDAPSEAAKVLHRALVAGRT